MKIAGLQKMTLLDYPKTVACIVFLPGCNFRCPYCHNTPLVLSPTEGIDENEVFAFLEKRRGILEGVVISGGEPTLSHELPFFMAKIKELGYRVKLDTNGTSPTLLKAIVDAGLVDYVAMDVKHAPHRYQDVVRGDVMPLEAVAESIRFLLDRHVAYEFRTTLVKGLHSEADMADIAQWIRGADAFYLQNFKDSGAIMSPEGLSSFSGEEMARFLAIAQAYVPCACLRASS
ncbi:MAG: anaerobic ribonucleoside-triphosphate reductase activating protein [Clostridia bacterium]|nr:anaerobic ribonucleoside-triphosphate reductase activating protein [Clostridia bacterium]